MPAKVPFSELSPLGKGVVSVVIALSVLLVVSTERDIQRRSDSELRGGKLVWRLASLNALGALAYRRWGRRR